jgi:RNA polymerase sigma-70 factor (ECF subfamily)
MLQVLDFQAVEPVTMSSDPDPPQQAPIDIEAAYEQYSQPIHHFLAGVLRNESLVADALQATFLKLMQRGDSVRDKSALKSWLFQVAYNEAMVLKRKSGVVSRHKEKVAWWIDCVREAPPSPTEISMRAEQVRLVREAIGELSIDQQAVVRKRIYEGLKFREIADELNVPLGTVLARMQSSLKKLRPIFEN